MNSLDINRTTQGVPEIFSMQDGDTQSQIVLDAGKTLRETPKVLSRPVRDEIAELRCNLPFVSVVPWPKSSFLVSLATNTSGEVRIPDGAILVKLSGQASFLFTEKGAADGQTSAQQATQGNGQSAADVLASGETEWMYCAGLRTISVRNPNAATQLIGARFIFRDEVL